jgi:hypothetical protein
LKNTTPAEDFIKSFEGQQRLLYDYGLPFDKPIANALDELIKRVKVLNKGALFMIDGTIGSGKTIGGVQFADYLNGAYEVQPDGTYKQIPENFINLEVQYSMGSTDFTKKLLACHLTGKRVIIYDEAGDFSKRSSLTRLNGDLNRIFETCRSLQIVIIMIMPNFYYVDRSILDKEMIRGLARISRNSQRYSDAKIWGVEGINWIKFYSIKHAVPSQCYNFVKPIMQAHILPLSNARMDEIQRISNKNKISIIKQIGNKSDAPKNCITKDEIVQKYGVNKGTLAIFLHNHKVKTIERVKNTSYYDANLIEKLHKVYGINTMPPENKGKDRRFNN